MREILTALGRRTGCKEQLWLVMQFAAVTTLFLAAGAALHSWLAWNWLLMHALAWLGWFVWHSKFFVLSREKLLRIEPQNAYRVAFYRHILCGVSFGAAQMFRPWFLDANQEHKRSSFALLLVALIVLAFGTLTLSLAFRAIGMAAAGFLFEFQDRRRNIFPRGIYALIRHPLFFGGALVSLGLAVLLQEPMARALGAANVAILTIYLPLEDMRSVRIFGTEYSEYIKSVPGFIPSLRAFRTYVFREQQRGAIKARSTHEAQCV